MGAESPPGPIRFPDLRGPRGDWRKRGYRRYAPGRRQLDSLRHFRHRLHSVGISPHPVVDATVRHRPAGHPLQLQCEIPWPGISPRFRLRHQTAAAPRDRQVPTNPEATALVWRADPFPVEAAERPQPVQLHQYGNGPQSGRFFRRLQVQDPEAHVRQLSDGDQYVRHARIALFEVSGVL